MSATTDPAFVLVRPQMGENVGAAARAMANFGLGTMRLVAPRDGWPNPRAVALASGAGRILDEAGLHGTTSDAVADCAFVFATTARPRDMVKPVMTPEAAMAEARRLAARGRRIAVLFGPERAGLENGEVALANAIVSVPVDPAFASLNLAQCVLLMGYEWRRQDVHAPAATGAVADLAELGEVERLAAHWDERLEEAGFFFPPQKAPHMRRSMRNLWSRMPLTAADVRVLHGALRQLVRRPGGSD